jgi:hypothetical protein
VAVRETEEAWLQAARGKTVRQLELARCVLGGPALGQRDEGRSSYQIALSVCPECGSGRQPANGQLVPVPPEIVEMAECDAQRLPALEENASHAGTDIEHEHRPDHEERPFAHVGNAGGERASTRNVTRARQDIPPALRRAVLRRDERRCRVAGCRNAIFLDLHHIQPRSEGGSHSADNLVTLCAAHHCALHRGELRSTGAASDFRVLPGELGVPVRDGAPHPPAPLSAPSSLDVPAKVASALCQLGFRAADVHTVIAELRQRSELAAAAPQQWLREASQRLHRAPARPR